MFKLLNDTYSLDEAGVINIYTNVYLIVLTAE